jgi:hypothetical protein
MKYLLIFLVSIFTFFGCEMSDNTKEDSWDDFNIKTKNNSEDNVLFSETAIFTRLEDDSGIIGKWKRIYKGSYKFPIFDEPTIYDRETYTFTFNNNGTYKYYLTNQRPSGNGFIPSIVYNYDGIYKLKIIENGDYYLYDTRSGTVNIYSYKVSTNYLLYTRIGSHNEYIGTEYEIPEIFHIKNGNTISLYWKHSKKLDYDSKKLVIYFQHSGGWTDSFEYSLDINSNSYSFEIPQEYFQKNGYDFHITIEVQKGSTLYTTCAYWIYF